MFAKIKSIGLLGLEAYTVEVETDISNGLPMFDIVGLPDAAVKESRERVRSSFRNCGFEFPLGRITVNLAPADKKKEGSIYDLPVFLAIIKAARLLDANLDRYAFIGELSLTGELRRVNGVLPMAIKAKEEGLEAIFIPSANAAEGGVVEGIRVFPIAHIGELLAHLTGKQPLKPAAPSSIEANNVMMPDFSEVRGQYEARRALEIAASGGHNMLLIGTPGSGKSMLAKRLPSILPEMTHLEQIETTKIHSIAGVLPDEISLVRDRPFRSPHHTITAAGLSGGGSIPKPGELSLAHNGVLFLDELPEFARSTLEVLRQPIEDGIVTISRASGSLSYPCSVMLVAAMNPCPCGYFGHPKRSCICSGSAVSKYLSRVSGPLLDRLDIHVEVPPVEYTQLSSTDKGESSDEIRKRVNKARKLQQERYKNTEFNCNARLTAAHIRKVCRMSDRASALLKTAFDKLGMSARAFDRILKVSRTIADLEEEELIQSAHIAEAIQYRSLDRKYWSKER